MIEEKQCDGKCHFDKKCLLIVITILLWPYCMTHHDFYDQPGHPFNAVLLLSGARV